MDDEKNINQGDSKSGGENLQPQTPANPLTPGPDSTPVPAPNTEAAPTPLSVPLPEPDKLIPESTPMPPSLPSAEPENLIPESIAPPTPTSEPENLIPESIALPTPASEPDNLIPESMRKLDALLKEIKLNKTRQPPTPFLPKTAAPSVTTNAQLLSLIQGKLDALGDKISEIKSQPPSAPPPPTGADVNAQVVDLMQGKLEAMGEKITEKLSTLLGELKFSAGPARDAKIREIQEVAGPEIIDISKLFNEKITSNLEEIGIEEKESKEVDKSLEKLRRLRGGK